MYEFSVIKIRYVKLHVIVISNFVILISFFLSFCRQLAYLNCQNYFVYKLSLIIVEFGF